MLGTPTRDRKTERREATRREILDAAWAVARERGLASVTLRDVADRVGMRPPSLYSHFSSKNAIYDAMYGQAWTDYLAVFEAASGRRPKPPRAALKHIAHTFFDFAVADLARYQLMNQRSIPGFEPTPESYAPAIRVFERLREAMAALGVRESAAIDLCTALVGGLVDQQLANDPGGDRWERLIDRAVDMYADHLGIPKTSRTRKKAL